VWATIGLVVRSYDLRVARDVHGTIGAKSSAEACDPFRAACAALVRDVQSLAALLSMAAESVMSVWTCARCEGLPVSTDDMI